MGTVTITEEERARIHALDNKAWGLGIVHIGPTTIQKLEILWEDLSLLLRVVKEAIKPAAPPVPIPAIPFPSDEPPEGWQSSHSSDPQMRSYWWGIESWQAWEESVLAAHSARMFTLEEIRDLYAYAYNGGLERGGISLGAWLQEWGPAE